MWPPEDFKITGCEKVTWTHGVAQPQLFGGMHCPMVLIAPITHPEPVFKFEGSTIPGTGIAGVTVPFVFSQYLLLSKKDFFRGDLSGEASD